MGLGARHRGELPHGAAVFILPAGGFMPGPRLRPPHQPPPTIVNRCGIWGNIRSESFRV